MAPSVFTDSLSGVPGTLSHLVAASLAQAEDLQLEPGAAERLRSAWRDRASRVEVRSVSLENAAFGAPGCGAFHAVVHLGDGGVIRARLLCPQGEHAPAKGAPVVLVLHDAGRGVRGWHHMLRFCALGYAALALDSEMPCLAAQAALPDGSARAACPDDPPFAHAAMQALALVRAAAQIGEVDGSHVVAWGDGVGGAIALALPALEPGIMGAAALNPATPHAADSLALAGLATCPALVGTGLMDEVAPVGMQFALARALAGGVEHKVYPKHAHERLNQFDDDLLRFLASLA